MATPKKKLLIVTAIFPPVIASGNHRLIRLVRYLTDMGVDVSVLTVDIDALPGAGPCDYQLMEKIPPSVEIIKVAPLFSSLVKVRQPRQAATRNGQNPPPKPKPAKVQQGNKSWLQGLKDAITLNLRTPDKFSFWIYPAIKAGAQYVKAQGIGHIFSSSPPGSAHLVARGIKKRTGVNWIADFRDPWSHKRWYNPEMTEFRLKRIREFERDTVHKADTLVMNTDELMADFESHYGGIIAKKSVTITNGYDPADFEGLPSSNGNSSKQIVICHTGTFYRERSPMSFLQGFQEAVASGRIRPEQFRIQFIGGVRDFAAELQQFLDRHNLHQVVELVPTMPHHECLVEMTRASLLLIVQPVTTIQIPAKMFEYVAMKKPIFAVCAEGAISNLIDRHRLGWWADFDRPEQIRDRLVEIAEFFASRGLNAWQPDERVLDEFNGKTLVKKVYDLL